MIALLLAGCVDYTLGAHVELEPCAWRGAYLACPGPLPFHAADEACGNMGLHLAGDGDLDRLTRVGSTVDVGVGWWVSWPEDYPCPAMNEHGASGSAQCDVLRPYVCEVVADTGSLR